MSSDFLSFNRYLFVFAHPDDEVHSCVTIRNLIQAGCDVHLAYVTSGDYHGPEAGVTREGELSIALDLLGVSNENRHLLKIPEREVMQSGADIHTAIANLAEHVSPDCMVGHDFEGGHNGNDLMSYCTSRVAADRNVPLFVFPAYHGWPEERLYNQFVPGQTETYIYPLDEEGTALKQQIIHTHASQERFFTEILESSSAQLMLSREILREVSEPIDYTKPPTDPVGYEYPGSSLTFASFVEVINRI